MRTIVIGDIHGNHKALQQVVARSNYDPKNDRLICMGDYVDGYPDSVKVINDLIEYQKLSGGKNIYIFGNHDQWIRSALNSHLKEIVEGDISYIRRRYDHMWDQGGANTFKSYVSTIDPKPDYEAHIEFFNSLKWYYIENNIAFVHGGWDVALYPELQTAHLLDPESLIWDRRLFERATHLQHLLNKGYNVIDEKMKFGGFDKIFIGHTATQKDYIKMFPNLQVCNIVNVDTGAGWKGKLTGYILETGEIIQSDKAELLYRNHSPRG